MSTTSFAMSESRALRWGKTEVVHSTTFLFMACAVILVVIAFMVPFSVAWNFSTYENFTNEAHIESSIREGTLSRELALGSLGLFGLAATAWPRGKELRLWGILGVLCIAYLAWSFASCSWSDDFGTSVRRLIAYSCLLAAAVGITRRSAPRQFVWIVFSCSLTWLSLGIVAELSLGTLRPWQPDYRFAGIVHPNDTGLITALLALSALYLTVGADRKHRLLYVVAGVACVFVLLTRSRTAVVSLVVAIVFWWMITAPLTRMLLKCLLLGTAAACVAIAVGFGAFDFSPDSAALGRVDNDMASLSGRVPLWNELLEDFVYEKPLVGHGFGAFWTADRVADVSHSQDWTIGNGHSAYIDLLLNVGLIGAVLGVAVMILVVVRAAPIEHHQAGVGYGFIAVLVVFGMLSGLLETTFSDTNYISLFSICGTCYLLFHDAVEPQHTSAVSQSPQLDRDLLYRRAR